MHADSGLPLDDILAWTHTSELPVFTDAEPAWPHLVAAGREVLERAGVDPAEVGQLIVAGSAEWDHPAWSPAAKVAAELGIDRAHCFELVNFCNAAPTAVQVAADALAAGRVRWSLVLLGERLSRSVDYADAESVALFNTGDCAVALLLSAADPVFELRHAASRTDPSWADHYVGEYEFERVVVRRRTRRLNLPQTYVRNYAELTAATLDALGRGTADVAWFLVNHMDRRVHQRLLSTLGIAPERSVFNYDRYGHLGAGDTFVALAELRAAGRLRAGDLVLLATSGAGFTFGVTALEYRGPLAGQGD
jgi:3-oxoacyl-[acyl-carrier-protein] synthase-3